VLTHYLTFAAVAKPPLVSVRDFMLYALVAEACLMTYSFELLVFS
jgi:hypothetical protein